METIYSKKDKEEIIKWNRHELDDELSTIRSVTIIKEKTPKYPIWSIQLEGSSDDFDLCDEKDWNDAVGEFEVYVSTCLD